MVSRTLDWRGELGRWLKPFLDRFGHKARRHMCPLYVSGLIGPGDRKSVQPMAERLDILNKVVEREILPNRHRIGVKMNNRADDIERRVLRAAGRTDAEIDGLTRDQIEEAMDDLAEGSRRKTDLPPGAVPADLLIGADPDETAVKPPLTRDHRRTGGGHGNGAPTTGYRTRSS
jgi:DDE superfamily endonuclease